MSAIITTVLQKEKVAVLAHPPYSPDLPPCDFFLIPKLKTLLAERRQMHESAVYQYLTSLLNQHTMTHSGSGFINRNYAFLVMGTTLRTRNKEICDYLHFKCSQSK